MDTAKPKVDPKLVDAEIAATMTKWIVDGLLQYGPAVAIAASMTALSTMVVAADMPKGKFLEVVGESFDKTTAKLEDVKATPVNAKMLAQLMALKLGTHHRIFCSCGVVVLQCACPGEKREATVPNGCDTCRRKAARP